MGRLNSDSKIRWRRFFPEIKFGVQQNVFTRSLFLAFLSIYFLAACESGEKASREHILLTPELDFWKEAAPADFKTRIQTTQGDFVIEAHRDWAPIGVDRFYNLVRAGFFDDSRFYRIRAGFISQFGLPGNPHTTQVCIE